jgi:uncharacterized protein YraI
MPASACRVRFGPGSRWTASWRAQWRLSARPVPALEDGNRGAGIPPLAGEDVERLPNFEHKAERRPYLHAAAWYSVSYALRAP